METLVKALGPVFIASMALQQLIEMLDPVLDKWLQPHKAWILSAVAFVTGLMLAVGLGLNVLAPFGYTGPKWAGTLLTALVLTGGTRWINDLVKVISYKKYELHARVEEG